MFLAASGAGGGTPEGALPELVRLAVDLRVT